VNQSERGLRGEALRRQSRVTVNPTVGVNSGLEQNVGASGSAPVHELVHLLLALVHEQALLDIHSPGAQCLSPATPYGRIRIRCTDHDMAHTGPEQGLCARRRPAEVIARLEGDVGRGP